MLRIWCAGRKRQSVQFGNIEQLVMGIASLFSRIMATLKLFIAAIAVLCLVTGAPALAAGKRVALVIGNSNYINGSSLPNPQNDARLVAQTARSAGFEVTQISDLAVVNFHQALRDFRNKADTAEVAMIYYAGHGIDNNGENWLIPTDVGLADPRDLQTEAIPLTEVLSSVSGAKLRVILLDACRNNPFADKWTSLTRAIQPGLSRIDATEGSLVIFAADPGSTILDDGTGGNSYFAKAISNRLAEPGLPLQMLGNKIYDDVRAASGGKQRVFPTARLSGMEYYLVAKPVDPNAGLDSDDGMFLRAQQLNTADAYLGYLNKFPAGKSRQIAANLYSALSRAESARSTAIPAQPVEAAPAQQAAYVPPPTPAVVVGPTYQAPSEPQVAPPVVAAVPQGYTLPPAQQQVVGPVIQQQLPPPPPPVAEPVPQVVTVRQPDVSATTVSSAPVAAQAIPQSGTYVAPPVVRQYGIGGFPIMPEPPQFQLGPYPTCKDDWQSVSGPLDKVNATIACKYKLIDYQSNWLNPYRKAMNAYAGVLSAIYTNEVGNRFPDREAEKGQFYNEMIRRNGAVKDGGSMMVDYERALAKLNVDFAAIGDSYNRAAGCGGYPTPAGIAKTAC